MVSAIVGCSTEFLVRSQVVFDLYCPIEEALPHQIALRPTVK
jgi:hypothetical protein